MTDAIAGQNDPFDVLCEIERRTLDVLSGEDGGRNAAEWVGVGIRLGSEQFVVARDEVREILMLPDSMTRVPGARPWIRGLSNVRGQLLPVIDLRDFLGSGTTPASRSVRVLVVRNSEQPVGIIVDEVYGFRRFGDSEYAGDAPQVELRCDAYLAGAFARGQETWAVLSMERVLASPEFGRAAA
jgi:twitching motility protein PilI